MRMSALVALLLLVVGALARADPPLLAWSPSSAYRETVTHPCLTTKPADLARARENMRLHQWARQYADDVARAADEHVERFTAEFIARMLEATTPLSTIFTPCPACRDQGKPGHPHGRWTWSERTPDRITCELCGTVFPNEKYPETVTVQSHWGTPQNFSFVGGETFVVFNYKTCRPSMSGCIRANKAQFMTSACRQLGEAYLLSGDARYARAVRLILLRLAEVYPHWLIHSGYGEFADMDPRVAAANILALPADEIVYPPNVPDRKLFAGFWQAGRATGHGQEGHFVRAVAFAYDATCEAKDAGGRAVYSDHERIRIERDVLLEGTILLTADAGLNNKSVGNRAAAGMVGIVTGHPGLVRFGLDGFRKTIDQWFLPDGGTPESPGYAMMTFSNTMDFPLAMRGYCDPSGYRDAEGKRLDNVDLYHATAYARAWAAMVDGLQGDCTLPPYGDTRAGSRFDPQFAEMLAANCPERPQYLALLRELAGPDLSNGRASVALYYRDPQLSDRSTLPPLAFPDVCLPELRIGHMRTGDGGRESLLTLSASRWGGHHHLDSLNLYYWKNGRELLGDLGYLWDNPRRQMTARTLAHNTMLIDEADQQTTDRGGEVEFFKSSPHVKVMRASSHAYPAATRYQRTSAIIDHGGGRNYVVDVFAVEGGKTQDLVFHGPNQQFHCDTKPAAVSLYDLTHVREIATPTLVWSLEDKSEFTARCPPQAGESVYVADGWGQRDPFNKDAGKTLPYIVRRTSGPGLKQFVSIFEGHPAGGSFVRGVRRTESADGGVTIEVQTTDGREVVTCGPHFSVTSSTAGKTDWTFSDEH
jgi:hypothetical protein